MAKRGTRWLSALVTLFGLNWITVLGGILAATSSLLIVGFMIIGLLQLSESPYLGIMAFLVLPGVLVFGLLIVPVGAFFERRRRIRLGLPLEGEVAGMFPVIDFNSPHTRRVGAIVIVVTACVLLVLSAASYEGMVYMDSPRFCGLVCHTVMEPEYVAYTRSPHARVACVECHIGPGAPWFVKAKLSGLGQVIAVALNNYETPIPTPVANLRPSRDTCEECHWPQKFTGDKVKVISKFQEDEKNTPVKTVMLLHIGGADSPGGGGIHGWHMRPGTKTYYVAADNARQNIVQVRVEEADGKTTVYKAADQGDPSTHQPERLMDCIDCHNRPTHIMQVPERALDEAMEDKLIDPSIPFIKKQGVEVLKGIEVSEADLPAIAQKLTSYYQTNHADFYKDNKALVDQAIVEIQNIYKHNVFPKMKVTWGTYANNLGHVDSKGCFRCHEGNLTSDDGKVVQADCAACHNVLAWEEENPEVLEKLQLTN